MFTLGRRDRPADTKEGPKPALKPALYDPPGALSKPGAGTPVRPGTGMPAYGRDVPPAAPAVPAPPAPVLTDRVATTPAPAAAPAAAGDAAARGSKLSVGLNIKLNGVEVSDCDVLVIEGHVEATVHSKAMEIAEPGTLKGTALIDVAEIHGVFSGDLTARTRLVVHGTGRVSGTIRYGKLIVAEGGELSGDVRRLDDVETPVVPARAATAGTHVPLGPEPRLRGA